MRVSAYQVTLQTPSGCKKFETTADKSLLEVRVPAGQGRRGSSSSNMHAGCAAPQHHPTCTHCSSLSGANMRLLLVSLPCLACRARWLLALRSPTCAGQGHAAPAPPALYLAMWSAPTSCLTMSRRRRASSCCAPPPSHPMLRSHLTRRLRCTPSPTDCRGHPASAFCARVPYLLPFTLGWRCKAGLTVCRHTSRTASPPSLCHD